MYKILIVEDEDIIRKNLVYYIPWDEMGCVVIAEARNGIEGIEAIKTYQPDIVIADINMPIMDGLKMIESTTDEYDYVSILLTGYSDFNYAKEAIKHGVIEYLLKPLVMDEMKEAIARAKMQCDIRQSYLDKLYQKDELRNTSLLKEFSVDMEEDKVVKEMIQFISDNYNRKIYIQDVVNHLNYSESYLNAKFKEAVGTTFIEYLNRYRIQKALKLLNNGEYTIQEIAYQCGIFDYKYFGIVFKKYMGCSPKEYQSEIK